MLSIIVYAVRADEPGDVVAQDANDGATRVQYRTYVDGLVLVAASICRSLSGDWPTEREYKESKGHEGEASLVNMRNVWRIDVAGARYCSASSPHSEVRRRRDEHNQIVILLTCVQKAGESSPPAAHSLPLREGGGKKRWTSQLSLSLTPLTHHGAPSPSGKRSSSPLSLFLRHRHTASCT